MSILNVRMGEGTDYFQSIKQRPVKCKNGGIGGGGKKNNPKWKRSGRLKFRSRTSKRGKEADLFVIVRELEVRELERVLGAGACDGMECDHILGRNREGFELGAMLDPQNHQFLTPAQHRAKTDGKKVDYRSVQEKRVLINLSAKILGLLPKPWTLKDLRKVLKQLRAVS